MQDRMAMVVLGMHRSGTSVMAGALAASGFRPPLTLMPVQPENPKGFWESSVIADLNETMLAAQDASWDAVYSVGRPLPPGLDAHFRSEAAEVMHAEFGDSERIVLKDPRMCRLAGFWKQVLSNLGVRRHFIVMIRSPGEVAASLKRRNAFSVEKSALLWLDHMLAAERETRGESRSLVLFEDLLAAPTAVLERIASDSGMPLPLYDRSLKLHVASLVDQDLRNHVVVGDANCASAFAELTDQAYEALRVGAMSGEVNVAVLGGLGRQLCSLQGLVADAAKSSASIQFEGALREVIRLVSEQAEVIERLQEELAEERSAMRLMVADTARITAELDAAHK